MHRMKPSEMRRRWFSVLDRVAAGEVVAVERHGRLVVLRREERDDSAARVPDYRRILRVPKSDQADRWHWEWPGPKGTLRIRTRKP